MAKLLSILTILALLLNMTTARQWPYDPYAGKPIRRGEWVAQRHLPEFESHPPNNFIQWLHRIVAKDLNTGSLSQTFHNGSIPHDVSLEDLIGHIDIPTRAPDDEIKRHLDDTSYYTDRQATPLFKHLPFPIDDECTSDSSKW